MIREILYDNTHMPLFRNALDAYADRHRVLASNLANAETPGFVPGRVHFEDALSQALADRNTRLHSTNPSHIPAGSDFKRVVHHISREEAPATGTGVTGVDVEKTMAEIATNQLQYQFVSSRAKGLFDKIRQMTHLP